MKKTAKKLVLSRETLITLEQVVGGATVICTYTAAATCHASCMSCAPRNSCV